MPTPGPLPAAGECTRCRGHPRAPPGSRSCGFCGSGWAGPGSACVMVGFNRRADGRAGAPPRADGSRRPGAPAAVAGRWRLQCCQAWWGVASRGKRGGRRVGVVPVQGRSRPRGGDTPRPEGAAEEVGRRRLLDGSQPPSAVHVAVAAPPARAAAAALAVAAAAAGRARRRAAVAAGRAVAGAAAGAAAGTGPGRAPGRPLGALGAAGRARAWGEAKRRQKRAP
jgi:hypothetical protein